MPLTFHPVAMAAEAIRGADVADVDARISTVSSLEGPLAEALAGGTPVEADYYYSLTGRYETIEHVAAILAELQHRAAAEDEPEPAADKTLN